MNELNDRPILKGIERLVGYFFYYYIFAVIGYLVVVLFFFDADQNTLAVLYTISRSAKCLASLLGIWFAYRFKNQLLLALFSVLAFASNPFWPVSLPKELWFIIDCILIVTFIISLRKFPIAPAFMPGKLKAPKPRYRFKTHETTKIFERITPKDEDRPQRENELWENILSVDELKAVHSYIIEEANSLLPTDWADYALRLICTHSPALSKLLINGDLNLNFIRKSEIKGLADGINAIKNIPINSEMSLREFFQDLFREIFKKTNYGEGNRFYWYGRDRIVQLLHSYMASRKSFTHIAQKFYDIDGEEIKFDTNIDTAILKKVRDSLALLESKSHEVKADEDTKKLKERHRFKIESEHPIIEFDLDRIQQAAVFKYEGSLVNSIYIELKNLLAVSLDCIYLETRVLAHQLFDSEAASFEYGKGIVWLVKYTAAVEYFPDRLYVELQDLAANSWIANWLRSYKLHIEGND